MSITINGQTSPATEFAWDGCHKIYLLDNGDADKNGKYGVHALQERRSRIQGAASLGTTARMGPILPAPLHQHWALDKNYVPQCYEKPVTIEAR